MFIPGVDFSQFCRINPRRLSVLALTGMMLARAYAGDILLRGNGGTGSTAASSQPVPQGPAAPAIAAQALPSPSDRLARNATALAAVKQFQLQAQQFAQKKLVSQYSGNAQWSIGTASNPIPVTSGLSLSGLLPDTGIPLVAAAGSSDPNTVTYSTPTSWLGVSALRQNTGVAQNTDATAKSYGYGEGKTYAVTVTQNQQEAVLNWQSFNISPNTTLNFDQSAGGQNVSQWIAFNRIGSTGVPSQILGSISTTGPVGSNIGGQVYVINPNGIVFGGTSKINVHSLVASSLPINPYLMQQGLLNDTQNFQFLFSAADIDKNGKKTDGTSDAFGTPSTDPRFVAPPGPNEQNPTGYGSVLVQPGAQLTSPASVDKVGGLVALVGPNVTNNGSISTEDGQTILAAGLQVAFTAHSGADATRQGIAVQSNTGILGLTPAGQADPTLRGLDVYIGAVVEPTINTTDISMPNYVPLQYISANGGYELNGPWAGVATNGTYAATDADGKTATGSGLIAAPNGNVTIAGVVVNQLGFVNSETSVALNGRIDLLADYNAFSSSTNPRTGPYQPFSSTSSGLVMFGASSITQILPSQSTTDTVVGSQLALPSQIDVQAHSVRFAADSSSTTAAQLLAPSASVTISAGDWRSVGSGETQLIFDNSGQIYLDAGSRIDVAGSQDTTASVSENIISMQLRGPELADSPVQRNGPLRGSTVTIDIRDKGTYNGEDWVGTPLADTNGYIGLIQRNAQELTSNGGTVVLNAGGSVVAQPGSSIDVSGGWINYQGAYVQTTKLIAAGGNTVDISQATPDQVYTGIYTGTTSTTDPKWGVTTTTGNPLPLGSYEAGYTQGGNGGALTISAPMAALDGGLTGHTTAGIRQINDDTNTLAAAVAASIDPRIWELDAVPNPSRLSILLHAQQIAADGNYYLYSPIAPDVLLTPDVTVSPSIEAFDPNTSGDSSTWGSRQQKIVLSSNLIQGSVGNSSVDGSGGFGVLDIDNSDGNTTLATSKVSPQALILPAGGSLNLAAANLDIETSVFAPGGKLNFFAYDSSPFLLAENNTLDSTGPATPAWISSRGKIEIGTNTTLSTAGLIVDKRLALDGSANAPLIVNGGTINLEANEVDLEHGSTIDVSGGGTVGVNSKVTFGNAGNITIAAGKDPFTKAAFIFNADGTFNTSLTANGPVGANAILGGGLVLDGALRGFSGLGGSGGTLSIQASAIQAGGNDPNTNLSTFNTLWLPADESGTIDFFNEGGFASFNLTGIGQAISTTDILSYTPAVLIASGASIHPVVQSWIANTNGGANFSPQTFIGVSPSSVSLKFVAENTQDFRGQLVVRGDLVMDAQSSITIDPTASASKPVPSLTDEGSVTLRGDTVSLGGSVEVPGGTIQIAGSNLFPLASPNLTEALPTVDLQPTALLSTAGQTVLLADPFGHRPTDAGYVPTGSVLNGGYIKIDGNIVAESGSKIDASGASGSLVVRSGFAGTESSGPMLSPSLLYTPIQIASNGGEISLVGEQELFSAAQLKATAGNSNDPKSSGGILSVEGGGFNPSLTLPSPLDTTLEITQSQIDFEFQGLGKPVLDAKGSKIEPELNTQSNVTKALAFFDVDSFNRGGFSSLYLQQDPSLADGGFATAFGTSPPAAVSFSGPVSVNASGSIAIGNSSILSGVIYADGKVSLQASYIDLGQTFKAPGSPVVSIGIPSYGTGKLEVVATQLIDVGNLSLQGIGVADLDAGGGDIRGNGSFDMQGNLSLAAGQIYPTTASTFNVVVSDYTLSSTDTTNQLGTVTIQHPANNALPQLPLSAGGTLNVFASVIDQGGVLRAPFGQINLGSVGSGPAQSVPSTGKLTLEATSVTSTSEVAQAVIDPATGKTVPLPYGVSLDGAVWFDPTGTDITVAGNGAAGQGLPSQKINLTATNVSDLAGAAIDVTGGGDLFAYQWVQGVGGSKDVLTSSASFAILPGYHSVYAPYAPFTETATNAAFAPVIASDPGYSNSSLKVGTQIFLNASNGLPAGDYTLLPARYALLPGAFLVTQQAGVPVGQIVEADGSSLTSGYTFNAFSGAGSLYSTFEVASSSVIQSRSQYTILSANDFLKQQAISHELTVPRLPIDAGELSLTSTPGTTLDPASMILAGSIASAAGTGGRGGLVSISSPEDIIVNGTGTGSASASTLYLNANELNGFNAESLLIGGTFTSSPVGTAVTVTANQLEIDNSGAPLKGSDIILVANKKLLVDQGADIEQVGTVAGTVDKLVFGQVNAIGSGDGALVRVSGDSSAQIMRVGLTPADQIDPTKAPSLIVGLPGESGASGPTNIGVGSSGSVTIDSTFAASLDPNAILNGNAINIDSRGISLMLDGSSVPTASDTNLVLSRSVLSTLQQSAASLSLLSYSSIDTYGVGAVGALDSSGHPVLANLSLHTGEIRGMTPNGAVSFNAQNILIDNSPAAPVSLSDLPSVATGTTLTFNGETIELGAKLPKDAAHASLNNTVNVYTFDSLALNATNSVSIVGAGGNTSDLANLPGLTTQGALAVNTPLLSASVGADQTIIAGGPLSISSPTPTASSTPIVTGLGSSLVLVGSSVNVGAGTQILLPSGSLTLHATGINANTGTVSIAGIADVGGQTSTLNGVSQSTPGGQITLTSDSGSVNVAGGQINLGAFQGTTSWAGSGGTLTVSAPNGTFNLGENAILQGGAGNFSLDVAALTDAVGRPTQLLSPLEAALGSFTLSQDLRVRSGDVSIDDTNTGIDAHSFNLSADSGSIDVLGFINASGATGGNITLSAHKNVTIESTAVLNASGQFFDDAGKGGSVTLEAGDETNGAVVFATQPRDISTGKFGDGAVLDIEKNSTIDLSVKWLPVLLPSSGGGGSSLTLAAAGSLFFPNGTPGNDQIVVSGSGAVGTIAFTDSSGNQHTDSILGGVPTSIQSYGTLTLVNDNAKVAFTNGAGGAIPIYLPANAVFSAQGATNLTGAAALTATQAGDLSGVLHLRAPQTADGTDVQINSLPAPSDSNHPGTGILGASSIIAEGFKVYDLSKTGGTIDESSSVQLQVLNDGVFFATTNFSQIQKNLLPGYNDLSLSPSEQVYWSVLAQQIHIRPGAEIINNGPGVNSGDLTLNTTWDLSNDRFGPGVDSMIPGSGEPGILTLRAVGNINFAYSNGAFASLSDGFSGGFQSDGVTPLPLSEQPLLNSGTQQAFSWSYRLVAGADFNAADFKKVQSTESLEVQAKTIQAASQSAALPTTGSLVLGSIDQPNFAQLGISYYQVIRTGTGDIAIYAGQDMASLNPSAAIYTAGQQAPAIADFDQPLLQYTANSITVDPFAAAYSFQGGNVTIDAQQNIAQYNVVDNAILTGSEVLNSTREMPTNWLYRRGYTDANGTFDVVPSGSTSVTRRGKTTFVANRPGTTANPADGTVTGGDIASTSWWIDFSNFFEGVGALGGGNVSLSAGRDVSNIDAVAPTNARMPGYSIDQQGVKQLLKPDESTLVELGGGDVTIRAGQNISGGVYYVERGSGVLTAGGAITSNQARTVLTQDQVTALISSGTTPDPTTWLPTTLFLGKGSFTLNADGEVKLGPVANPFLLPQGINNSIWEKTYFSTYAPTDSVSVSSLTGAVTLADDPQDGGASLLSWYTSMQQTSPTTPMFYAQNQPWLSLAETSSNNLAEFGVNVGVFDLMPPSLRATSFSGDINIVGGLTLAPSASGTVELLASHSINGLQPNGLTTPSKVAGPDNVYNWDAGIVNLSDADPTLIPGPATPLSLGANAPTSGIAVALWWSAPGPLNNINNLLNESGATEGPTVTLQTKEALHAPSILHLNDPNPINLDATSGDISGFTLFSAKAARIEAGNDITDINFYIQNTRASDVTVIASGRDFVPYDPASSLINQASAPGNFLEASDAFAGNRSEIGDVQVSGPGTLEVLVGRNLNLGTGGALPSPSNGMGLGITSVGDARNPFLPFDGAGIVIAAGISATTESISGGTSPDLSEYSQIGFTKFLSDFLDPSTAGAYASRYLPELAELMGVATNTTDTPQSLWNTLVVPEADNIDQRDRLALNAFFLVLRDAGRDRNDIASANFGNYTIAYQAIKDLFAGSPITNDAPTGNPTWSGSISLAKKEVKTANGGDITLLAPGGDVTVGRPGDAQTSDQGVLTQHGGNISIFVSGSVNVGTSRIFTLRGGNETIWSSTGDIAAGSGSKTVFSAPPTRVLIDPQSADVENDLSGLATGSGIGVLATLVGARPGDVDLIAPIGSVDAGDAGIRASGNLNIAAEHVLNASNIQVGGATTGTPPPPAAPNIAGLTSADSSSNATSDVAKEVAKQEAESNSAVTELPSLISVEVIGYGGGEGGDAGLPSESGEDEQGKPSDLP